MAEPSSDALPFASGLVGNRSYTTGTRFGYEWFSRTYGLGAIAIEWSPKGLQTISVECVIFTRHPSFLARFAASTTRHWLKLMQKEWLVAVHVAVSQTGDRITAVSFETNLRRTQWFGSQHGREQTIRAPAGYCIHMIHGVCDGGTCRNLGGYFVPLALRSSVEENSVKDAYSTIMGTVPYDATAHGSFVHPGGRICAIVVDVPRARIWPVSPILFRCNLAIRRMPMAAGTHVVVLVDGELITALRVSAKKKKRIDSIQIVTTHRTTEWFGPVPARHTVIQERNVKDEPWATHIGGIYGMLGPKFCLASVGVIFCKHE